MQYTQNAINVLAVSSFKGIGRAWLVNNWDNTLKGDATIVQLINQRSKQEKPVTIEDFERKKYSILSYLTQSENCMDGVIAIGDVGFPKFRGCVKKSDQPRFLFYKGDLSLLNPNNQNIAVIGLLTPTAEIEKKEQIVVRELIERNVTIISGLALGCDTIAHKTALECGGKTVAILPSPLNSIIPSSNRQLAIEILAKGGLLVTEYLTDAKSKSALSGRYQERDRLQAIFSNAIVLSASYAKNDLGLDSGSRLAMDYAGEYGIPRGVIYEESEASNTMFDLNRQYMRNDSNVVVIRESSLALDIDRLQCLKPRSSNPIYTQKKMF